MLSLARAPSRLAGWWQREEAIMGTAVNVELHAECAADAESAMQAVMDVMHGVNRLLSPHLPSSELSRINAHAGQAWVPVSPEVGRLLERALHFSVRTGGAFDITFASVGALFDYRAGLMPTETQWEQGRELIGHAGLQLNAQRTAVRFARPGMRIDLGGFAKGWAVDEAMLALQRLGVRHACVSAGGDSRVMGERGGRPWSIGIRDPRHEGRVVAVLPLQDVSISTSGDYERYFLHGGVRHHHLIDPRSGRSPSQVRSVTVLADDGLSAEAWSKAVFVLGVREGLARLQDEGGLDAVVVDAQGALHYSIGLQAG